MLIRLDPTFEPSLRSEHRLALASCVPEGQDVEALVVRAVVNEVPDAAEEQPTNARCTCTLVLRADTWLFCKRGNGFAEVLADGAWRGGAIDQPPLHSRADLGGCARSDVDAKRPARGYFGSD